MIGTIAAILTTLSFLPQAYQVIKTKDTSGISLGMYTMFVLGVFYGLFMVGMFKIIILLVPMLLHLYLLLLFYLIK